MPYISYFALHEYLYKMGVFAKSKLASSFPDGFKNSVFDNNGEFRWAASSKLLQLLGYGDARIYDSAKVHGDAIVCGLLS